MKIYLVIFIYFVFTLTACAQRKMSDVEFDGLKGKVKSVTFADDIYDLNGNISRKKEEFYLLTSYSEDGKKVEYSSCVDNFCGNKTTVWETEDYTFSKNVKLPKPPQTLNQSANNEQPPPNAPPPPRDAVQPKNLRPKDESFDIKYKKNYDANGNLAEKFIYGNQGQIYNRRVYTYDSNRNKLKEAVYVEDGNRYNDSTLYSYDSKGNVTQEINLGSGSGQESSARISHKLTFVYVKFDKKGNWLERKVFDSVNNRPLEGEPKLVRIEYQTVTYY